MGLTPVALCACNINWNGEFNFHRDVFQSQRHLKYNRKHATSNKQVYDDGYKCMASLLILTAIGINQTRSPALSKLRWSEMCDILRSLGVVVVDLIENRYQCHGKCIIHFGTNRQNLSLPCSTLSVLVFLGNLQDVISFVSNSNLSTNCTIGLKRRIVSKAVNPSI